MPGGAHCGPGCATPGGATDGATSLIDGRRRPHHRCRRRRRRADGQRALAGLALPGLANAHSHAFHRALRGRTQAARHVLDVARHMYHLAATLDPDSYHRAGAGDVRRDGAGRLHVRRRVPLPPPRPGRHAVRRPERDGRGADRGRRRGAGLRITLLDTCYLRAGLDRDGTIAPGRGRAAAVQRRGRRRRGRRGSTRCAATERLPGRGGHPLGAGGRPGVDRAWSRRGPTAPRAPLHAHVAEQPAENEQCRAAYGLDPTRAAGRSRRAGRSVHRRARHPPDRPRHGRAGRRRRSGAACARRPSATWPTGSGRRPLPRRGVRRCASAPTRTP